MELSAFLGVTLGGMCMFEHLNVRPEKAMLLAFPKRSKLVLCSKPFCYILRLFEVHDAGFVMKLYPVNIVGGLRTVK